MNPSVARNTRNRAKAMTMAAMMAGAAQICMSQSDRTGFTLLHREILR